MQPRLICICGPNGAGKSTYTRTIATMENLLVIDPDKLAADGLSPIAAGKAAAKMARLFLENGVSFARESTLTSHFDFTLMSEAKKKGYSIELVYIGLESQTWRGHESLRGLLVADILFLMKMLSVGLYEAWKICPKPLHWQIKPRFWIIQRKVTGSFK